MDELRKIVERLLGRLSAQRQSCARVDSWMRPELARGFDLPLRASREHRGLADLSRTPWLRLVVDNVVQAMFVDAAYRGDEKDKALWAFWQRNALSSRQVSVHRAMIAYGHAYVLVGESEEGPVVRAYSPARIAVEYSELDDIYPSAALVRASAGRDERFRLYVPGHEMVIAPARDRVGALGSYEVVADVATGLDRVPVVRFANQIDLDGRVIGEVEPFIPAAQRINKTAYDRLLAQHFNSWKVKTVTGMDLPTAKVAGDEVVDQEAAERMKLKLAQEDILVGEDPDTRFGVLDATALEPFVASWRSDIEALAAVSQTPTHALTGQMVNMSAEALAAARGPLMQKVHERQMNAGDAWAQVLRIGAELSGDDREDSAIRVTWQDMEIRSLSQAADALGKIAQMLGVPKTGLWGLIPGVEQSDIEQWETLAVKEAEADPLNAVMRRHGEDALSG